jgi:hypothetical protein
MKKFMYNGSENEKEYHWETCERNKVPFIIIDDRGEFDSELFYDITNIARSDQLELISDKIKTFYRSYVEFSCYDIAPLQKYFDEYYFFRFSIEKKCIEIFGNKLFDYLNLILEQTRN